MSDNDTPYVPVELLRRRPSGGRQAWRSLEELAGSDAFREVLEREFPEQASEWDDPDGRRHFIKMMGASLALAGLTGCTRQPDEKIVPYVRAPELVPGRSLYFATALLEGGYAKGVLVESQEGRPIKVEGNPDHPASLGATDAQMQASILGLYDPDRSQTLTYLGEIRPWGSLLAAMKSAVEAQRPLGGAGIRILTGAVTSPTVAEQMRALLSELPQARWHQWEPAGAGLGSAGGDGLEPRYHLDQADVVVSLDADFIGQGPANLAAARAFTARRRVETAQGAQARPMIRLYAVESSPSLTGALADHRLAVRAADVEPVARALAAALGAGGGSAGAAHGEWIGPLARDLQGHRGRCVVMAGETQPPAVHALARAMNQALGAVGTTVDYAAPAEGPRVDPMASLRELAADMEAGKVALLVVAGANPVYTAPVDLDFARRMEKVAVRVHLGLYYDETAERCHWHVPEAHTLEAWGDARAFDGTVTIQQPLIAPLYGGRSLLELLATFTARPERTGYEIVRERWQARASGDFEGWWRRAVHDGVVAEAPPAAAAGAAPGAGQAGGAPTAAASSPGTATSPGAGGGYELIFRADPNVHDGRYANNAWLQELPRPLTKITWDNAALISPATAQKLGISMRATARGTVTDEVELRYRGRSVRAPAFVMPGHPDGSVTVHLGYGRTRAGRVGTGVGFNAYLLRTSDAPWFGSGLDVVRTGAKLTLAVTQEHWAMENRNLVRAVSLAEYGRDPHVVQSMGHEPSEETSLYGKPFSYPGHAWGMAIDLSACVGCNACVVACQAENNIPVVGKEQVAMGREMLWLRVDRYYDGPAADPRTYFQPVPCMHCENAPCETVCPVAATVHSDEGLNDMVYNRCVGTRYCSNNCPYKVRRFNFFLYQDWDTPSLKLMRNPEVTVRSRGVMEKCTYCVQRIQRARIDARNEGRPIRDGEIQTACQQACPGQAIVFGDINQKESAVSAWKATPRNYGLLADLNTRPRTTYLATVRNPNPEMPGAAASHPAGPHA